MFFAVKANGCAFRIGSYAIFIFASHLSGGQGPVV